MSRLKKYFAAFSGWFTPSVTPEESIDPSRLSESLLPIGQLYGFEMSWLRARGYGEK
ncbi:hypothetical protein J3D56_004006 [Erwinia persicina]|jgi:hypothetical protein|uniref:Uncharacterized protein n=1 Tax=Erwinia plantamica TaxID=3237104 RepID=A0ABW7CGX4_9GAMM|nr:MULTISPECIES: hypothetical protein [Erwinia]MCP1440570.1 hypothetical protein [Erwinia persicina]MDN8542358.1 hypothetical protein [Erwinia sp. BC051422]